MINTHDLQKLKWKFKSAEQSNKSKKIEKSNK